ncbi:hypothetical protein [Azospirillum argentinense]
MSVPTVPRSAHVIHTWSPPLLSWRRGRRAKVRPSGATQRRATPDDHDQRHRGPGNGGVCVPP